MPDIRNMRKERFAWVENEIAQDPTISLRALGLYTLMVSYPQDWRYRLSHLAEQKTDSLYATKQAFNELVDADLVMKKQARDEHNQFAGYEYHVIGIADKDKSPSFEIPSTGIPSDGVPVDGESHTTKKQNTNKQSTNKQNKETKDSFSEADAQEFVDIYNQHRGDLPKAMKANADRIRKLKKLVNEHGVEEAKQLLEAATRQVATNSWYIDNNHGLGNLLANGNYLKHAEAFEANKPKVEPSHNDRSRLDRQASAEYFERTEHGEQLEFEDVRREVYAREGYDL